MFLPNRLCKIFHLGYWRLQSADSIKVEHQTYDQAHMCKKCLVLRYVRFIWCSTCEAYMKKNHIERQTQCQP